MVLSYLNHPFSQISNVDFIQEGSRRAKRNEGSEIRPDGIRELVGVVFLTFFIRLDEWMDGL